MPVAPNLLSYHLRVPREAGLIAGVGRGRWVNYHVAAVQEQFVADALAAAALAATPNVARRACDAEGRAS